MKELMVSNDHSSPYGFDLKDSQLPPRDHLPGIKLQCVLVLMLLTTELAAIWLRPVYLDVRSRHAAALSAVTSRMRSISRDEFYELMRYPNDLESISRYIEVITYGCIAAQLVSYMPFIVSVFWGTSRDNLLFRYLVLLAASVPLAIGLYNQDLVEYFQSLPTMCRMAFQYMVIALSSHVLYINASNVSGNRQKALALLSAVPVTFLTIASIQRELESISVVYTLAAVATALLLTFSFQYVRLCLRKKDAGNDVPPAFM